MTRPLNPKLYLDQREITDSLNLVDVYRTRIESFGYTGRMMFYKNEAQHQRKLRQFADLLRRVLEPSDTLLDVGCGYGSLFTLLPECHYRGIDVVPEFISLARTKYPHVEFEVKDIEHDRGTYDWCVLLGVVNSVPDPRKIIETVWQNCAKGLIVDFVDVCKLKGNEGFLNRFKIGDSLTDFLALAPRSVEVYPTPDVWTIFLVRKP
jgi:SAM-dependent methyltransferase